MKKVTFKDESKKKAPKDPFDLEGGQKILKTMSNEMVEIKKQVAKSSSKKPFRSFKRNQTSNPQPPNTISNVGSDLDEDDELSALFDDETEDEELVEVHGMWDFTLPTFDNEDEQEALPVSTRSKGLVDSTQSTQKQKPTTSATNDKVVNKKASSTSPQPTPSSSNHPSSSKTLLLVDTIEYNIVEDMKKARENISLHELSKLKHQQKLLLEELNVVHASPLPAVVLSKASRGMGKPPNDSSNKVDPTDAILIGDRSNSITPPFLLTYEIFNKNLHNYLIDSGAFSNTMPRTVCTKLNVSPQKSAVHIVQLDRKC